jgi:hypothetical protein
MRKIPEPTNVKKSHIKHSEFLGMNISALESHPRVGKTLKTPFSKLGTNLVQNSWLDASVPNIVWACIVAAHLERETYLELFRRVVADTPRKSSGERRPL